MIVVDASAVIEVLLATPNSHVIERRMHLADGSLHAPQLLDIEVLQVLRRLCTQGVTTANRCREALDDLSDLPIARYGHESLVARIWGLRHNMTAYDAAYVALAEALDAPLITRDRRLGNAPGHTALIEVV
jgi:predicted nucleic acid-binding protein